MCLLLANTSRVAFSHFSRAFSFPCFHFSFSFRFPYIERRFFRAISVEQDYEQSSKRAMQPSGVGFEEDGVPRREEFKD